MLSLSAVRRELPVETSFLPRRSRNCRYDFLSAASRTTSAAGYPTRCACSNDPL